MADNYLENRYNQLFNQQKTIKKIGQTFDSLLVKCKNNNSFNSNILPSLQALQKIVEVNKKIDFFEINDLFDFLIFQTTPSTIIVCQKNPDAINLEIALGFSIQTMLLKASEIGFASNLVLDFDKEQIISQYNLSNIPLAVIKIGKLS